ncbi:unnamed protein product [marine sediment metagenome]|uniref:Uncharacterized protein n=1 Tax=marine sediment metagenome TaxID=412755 RepID=X0US47_9ZZZZ
MSKDKALVVYIDAAEQIISWLIEGGYGVQECAVILALVETKATATIAKYVQDNPQDVFGVET